MVFCGKQNRDYVSCHKCVWISLLPKDIKLNSRNFFNVHLCK